MRGEARRQFDLIVLDVMLPDGSGLDICRDLRDATPHVPIILLTALKEDVDRIIGLELGADDYLGKPFNPRELTARIRAVLRRRAEAPPRGQRREDLPFRRLHRRSADPRVTDAQGGDVDLTGAEFDLLQVFLDRPGRLLSRDQLLDLTQGRERDPLDRSVDVLISRLRRKFADDRRRAAVQDGAQWRLPAHRPRRGGGRRAMNSLRVKIALLLVIVIVAVVGLATVVLFNLLGPPPELFTRPGGAADRDDAAPRRKGPRRNLGRAPGRRLVACMRAFTQKLRDALAARGFDLAVSVARRLARAADGLGAGGRRGWLCFPITDLPPHGAPWQGLVRWLLLITFGATAIAVFVANRMVRPLELLESAVEQVGPDGVLPDPARGGPAEVRATAQGAELAIVAAEAGHGKPHAAGRRRRPRSPHADDPHAAARRVRRDEEERDHWLTDLDELDRIADSAIRLVREESGKAPPELIQLDELVGSIGAELRDQKSRRDRDDGRAGQGAGEPAYAQSGAAQPHHQCGDARRQRARRGRPLNGAARIVIEDDGPGLPPDLLDQVFEPFFRADPARRQDIRGAGLG